MPVDDWRDNPNPCRAKPHLFFSDLDTETNEAKALCADCPSRVRCLDHAIRQPEHHGIWGGMGLPMREYVRAAYLEGPDQYRSAMLEAFAELDVWVRKPGATREPKPVEPCARCGAPITRTSRPIDKNGPSASCGKVSTYNKGCRCDPCIEAKQQADRRRRT